MKWLNLCIIELVYPHLVCFTILPILVIYVTIIEADFSKTKLKSKDYSRQLILLIKSYAHFLSVSYQYYLLLFIFLDQKTKRKKILMLQLEARNS